MPKGLTDEEHREACVWMDVAFQQLRAVQAAGKTPYYLTAGSRVWWLLTLRGKQKAPVIGMEGPDGPTLPIFPMNATAVEFPSRGDGIERPLHGIAVVVR